MFDCHAHPGLPADNAFVCTATTSELPLLSGYKHKALGFLPGHGEPDWETLSASLSSGHELGEVGLDKRFGNLEGQEKALRKALGLAMEHDSVVVLHSVRAYSELLGIIKDYKLRYLLHGWTGSYEMAREFLALGCLISLGPRAERTKAFPRLLTLPFVTETDLPVGKEQEDVLRAWNGKLSVLTGSDIGERSERMIRKWL